MGAPPTRPKVPGDTISFASHCGRSGIGAWHLAGFWIYTFLHTHGGRSGIGAWHLTGFWIHTLFFPFFFFSVQDRRQNWGRRGITRPKKGWGVDIRSKGFWIHTSSLFRPMLTIKLGLGRDYLDNKTTGRGNLVENLEETSFDDEKLSDLGHPERQKLVEDGFII
ncbi:uncharacterized protein J3D65DRAFT_459977 [Phyllosticta citribraziliensis]|uniref:Uncharacterized protein n=1 Tax=Phyllosticta citribraziliensis TaxID=989973 RepID=A0ABR1LH05_9PEZI